MCVSRLYQVVDGVDGSSVMAEDVDGRLHRLSLLAFEGPAPHPGEWLVAHSGFALGRADAAEGAATVAEIRAVSERNTQP